MDFIISHSPCLICQTSAHSENIVCQACLAKLPWHPQPIEYTQDGLIITPWRYAGVITRLIKDLKFGHKLSRSRALGGLLGQFIREREIILPECLIPIPLHPHRIRERGFNQSLEVCHYLNINLPIDTQSVIRVKSTQPQAQLAHKLRYRNTVGAFKIEHLPAKHLTLVDDVITSGHTARALKHALLSAGAARVDIWCCASAQK